MLVDRGPIDGDLDQLPSPPRGVQVRDREPPRRPFPSACLEYGHVRDEAFREAHVLRFKPAIPEMSLAWFGSPELRGCPAMKYRRPGFLTAAAKHPKGYRMAYRVW